MDKTLERIICRYLDGTATPEEVAKLDQHMKEDPEVRRTLLTYSVQDIQIGNVLREKAGADQDASETGTPLRRETWFHRWGPSSPRLRRAGWAVAAAAMLMIAILFYAFTKMSRETRPVSTLTAAAVSSSQIDLTWTAGSAEDMLYVVERGEDGLHYTPVAQRGKNETFFTDKKLTPSTAYQYRVTTQTTSGRTISSDPVRVKTMSSSIVNTSSRGMVGTGYRRMIVGFIIRGDAPKKVFIRTRGPSLAETGVSDALANPVLEVYSMDLMKVIARNDDWQVYDPLGEKNGYRCGGLDEIRATALVPRGDLESAVLITLPPGTYAGFLSGVGDGTGLGMVEVFEVNE